MPLDFKRTAEVAARGLQSPDELRSGRPRERCSVDLAPQRRGCHPGHRQEVCGKSPHDRGLHRMEPFPSCHHCTRRGVFLQIEPVADYSSLAPLLCARRYGHYCAFNEGHEPSRIPADEILAVRVEARICREYLDPDDTAPNTLPLVL